MLVNNKISLLLTCRKDSKFLAKFIMAYMINTTNFNNVELLVLTPPGGTWNKEILEYFSLNVKVFDDNTGLGRGGSHVFYNMLAEKATGGWLWYLCDDHYLYPRYDEYIKNFIGQAGLLDTEVNVIAPRVDNSGRISHIISRKVYDTIGFGPQGNVDSCLNDTIEHLEVFIGKERHDQILHLPQEPLLHDFSLDKDLFKSDPFDAEYEKALFKSKPIRDAIASNAKKLFDVMREGLK